MLPSVLFQGSDLVGWLISTEGMDSKELVVRDTYLATTDFVKDLLIVSSLIPGPGLWVEVRNLIGVRNGDWEPEVELCFV